MTSIEIIELLLRGGAAAISLLLILQLVSQRSVTLTTFYGVMVFISASVYSVLALPSLRASLGDWIIICELLGMPGPAWLWLFIRALHDDERKHKWFDLVPVAAIIALRVMSYANPDWHDAARWLQVAIIIALMMHMIHVVRCCMGNDLVASRRHFSRSMAWIIPLIAIAIIGIDLIEASENSHELARLFTAVVMFVGTILFAMALSRLRGSLLQAPAARERLSEPATNLTAADRIDLGRIRDVMEEGAYLNAGLTIGALANDLHLPEHRLRKLINGGLGYRNFASFINDHRIAMAKRELSKPDMASTQITRLAFDVGYASLAPFNRAFRERTGMSPSEFREQMLQAQLQ